jgi:pimeloyl-ACP methyl ester carboxylesterase
MAFWLHKIVILFVVAALLTDARPFSKQRRFRRGRLGMPPPRESNDANKGVETKTFTQPLDHFDPKNTVTWQQRYQVDEDYYKNDGPFFFMIGGEGAIQSGWLTTGQMIVNAKKHGALVFQPEHRFYGQSHPTADVSVENLKYLSSSQALADLDNFIKGMKKQYNRDDAKVIVFGGSYSGNLAAWFRELYPDTAVGAIASSAPVLAEVDFVQYIEDVGAAQKYYVDGCYDTVNDAFVQIQQLVANKDDKQLDDLFGICDKHKLNYTDNLEVESFYDQLMGEWMGTTQYNDYGNTSQLAQWCREVTNTKHGQDALHRYSYWFKNVAGVDCANVDYKSDVETLKKTSWNSAYTLLGERQWLWQTCTEFAYYQTTDSMNQPFGYRTVALDYEETLYCNDVFGVTDQQVNSSVDASNQRYGGLSPQLTNVFFFHGSIDPWHTIGIYQGTYNGDYNPSSPIRFIEGTSHCYDMYDTKQGDPQQLIQARADASATIDSWLAK